MNLFYIARKNLSAKPLQTTLSIILLAFGIGMSTMILTEKQIQDQFDRNLKDIDPVLRAKGSGLQSILQMFIISMHPWAISALMQLMKF